MGALATTFGLGKTYYGVDGTINTSDYGRSVELEGSVRTFADYSSISSSGGVSVKRSNRTVTAILVRNVATVALLPKRGVRWKAGSRGKRVDGYSNVSYSTSKLTTLAGIVDPHLPAAGVRVGDLFWLIVSGPVLAKMTTSQGIASITEGLELHAKTLATSTGATDDGAVDLAVVSSADTTVAPAMLRSVIGCAISAVTSQSTGRDILIDLQLQY